MRRSLSPSETREQPLAVVENVSNSENVALEEDKIRSFQMADYECEKTVIGPAPSSSKNCRFSRDPDRYRTQPVTQEEIMSSQR